MNPSRFCLAFLAVWLSTAALAAAPSVQDANQAFRQGNHSTALSRVNSFLATNPKDAQGRFLKGLILTELNRYGEAIKVFSDLTEDFPELPEPYNNLAVLYAAQADYERAKQSLEMAIRTHPSYATAHENLGDIYAKMASQAYDKALQLDKSNTSALTKLSMIRDLFSPTPRPQETTKVADAGKSKSKPVAKPAAPTNLLAQETAAPGEAATAAAEDSSAPAETRKPRVDNVKPQENPVIKAADGKTRVEQTIKAWAEAWSNRDSDTYLSFYAADFKTPRGQNRDSWSAERKTRVTRPEFIKVEIDRLKIDLKGDTAKATFRQRYESNILKNTGSKTLVLSREGETWKIIEER